MRYRVAAFLLASGLVAVAALILRLTSSSRDSIPELPRIILWAWERPEKLGFIDPARIGVAFLERTCGARQWWYARGCSRSRFLRPPS